LSIDALNYLALDAFMINYMLEITIAHFIIVDLDHELRRRPSNRWRLRSWPL